jgi:hypothetical protein
MDITFGILVILAVVGFFFMRWLNTRVPKFDFYEDSNSTDTEVVSTESPSTAVTTAPSRSTSAVTPAPRRTTHASTPTDYETLSSLPTIYYVLAIFCGVVLLIVTLVNAGDLSGAEIGGLIGYTVGAVLSMFAIGRVIELLQQIRDAVRNTPAPSPSRPDDE